MTLGALLELFRNARQRRRWSQLHLSTALIASLVAAGVLWGNVRKRAFDIGIKAGSSPVAFIGHGWPLPVTLRWATTSIPDVSCLKDAGLDPCVCLLASESQPQDPSSWSETGLAIDVLLAVLILVVVIFACEWWIIVRSVVAQARREERQVPGGESPVPARVVSPSDPRPSA
jgi:hypothetical protein